MTPCARCHHPQHLHMRVYKREFEWPCLVEGCGCEEFTLRPADAEDCDEIPPAPSLGHLHNEGAR